MKILIVGNGHIFRQSNHFFIHREIKRFLSECVDLGLEVSFATSVFYATSLGTTTSVFPEKVGIENILSLSHSSFWKRPFLLFKLIFQSLLVVLRYDLIYCFFPGKISSLFIVLSLLFKKNYALYIRGNVPNSLFSRITINCSRFIFCTGVSIVHSVCPQYEKCFEVSPMTRAFSSDCSMANPRQLFHTPLRGLFVGNVTREKGCYDLLDALRIVKDMSIPVTMNFVGPLSPGFEEAVTQMNLNDYITLSGPSSNDKELQQYYLESDFFCLPSWSEGFPRVLYEAMCNGLPCITTMVGGIPSRMHNLENCIAINAHDPKSIYDAFLTFVNNHELMTTLSQASLKTFLDLKNLYAGQSHAQQLYAEVSRIFF